MCRLHQETKIYYMVILWILIYHRVAKTSNYVLLYQLFCLNTTEIPKI